MNELFCPIHNPLWLLLMNRHTIQILLLGAMLLAIVGVTITILYMLGALVAG